ncbi:MAG: hypothetical protein ACREIC_29340 [Limisphaerales bacterium]
MSRKWRIPECLKPKVSDEDAFRTWLDRKAKNIRKRDRKRHLPVLSLSVMKQAIVSAIERSNGCDFYTVEPLDWHLISKWVGSEEGSSANDYRRKFWMLPSVDHDFTDPAKPAFHICSWRMNDSKNDQSIAEFLQLAAKVKKHLGDGPP